MFLVPLSVPAKARDSGLFLTTDVNKHEDKAND
jgi:hypothetical protein